MWAGNTFLSNTRAFLNEPELNIWHLLSPGTEQHYTLMRGRISTTECPTPSFSKYLCRSSSPHHSPTRLHSSSPGMQQEEVSGTGRVSQDWGAMTVVHRDVGPSQKLCQCEHPDKHKRPCPLPSLIIQFSICSGRDITVFSKGGSYIHVAASVTSLEKHRLYIIYQIKRQRIKYANSLHSYFISKWSKCLTQFLKEKIWTCSCLSPASNPHNFWVPSQIC